MHVYNTWHSHKSKSQQNIIDNQQKRNAWNDYLTSDKIDNNSDFTWGKLLKGETIENVRKYFWCYCHWCWTGWLVISLQNQAEITKTQVRNSFQVQFWLGWIINFLLNNRVLVLEANPRVGGRTQTLDILNHEGQPDTFDLGAHWICKRQNYVMELVDKFGIQYYPQNVSGRKVLQVQL